MADEKTHRIEIDIPGVESGTPGKLIIDGNDLSHYAHEVRIVLTAGKTPQIQVDLYGIGGLGAKLEEAGLILNVTKPGELSAMPSPNEHLADTTSIADRWRGGIPARGESRIGA